MQIQSSNPFTSSHPMSRSLPKAETRQFPQDKLTLVEPPPPGYNPNTPMPGGQYIVGGVAAIAMGALGAYAGLHGGTAATLAGVAAGAVTGGVGLGVVGIMADLGSFGSSNKAGKAALAGGIAGGLVGGLVGALANNTFAAVALGGLAAVTGGYAATAFANEAFSN